MKLNRYNQESNLLTRELLTIELSTNHLTFKPNFFKKQVNRSKESANN